MTIPTPYTGKRFTAWKHAVKDIIIPGHYVITMLRQYNPKRAGQGPARRFALYRNGQTVAQYQAACAAAGVPAETTDLDIKFDIGKGYIRVAPASCSKPDSSTPRVAQLVRRCFTKLPPGKRGRFPGIAQDGASRTRFGRSGIGRRNGEAGSVIEETDFEFGAGFGDSRVVQQCIKSRRSDRLRSKKRQRGRNTGSPRGRPRRPRRGEVAGSR